MNSVQSRLALGSLFVAMALIVTSCAQAQAAAVPASSADPVVTVDFSSPAMDPSHWLLTIHPDGSGHFRSEAGTGQPNDKDRMDAPGVDRDVHLSPEFSAHVFQVAQRHNWFQQECESHLKVAFQGWKKLSYSGPEGQGSCTFNYSKDKDIADLGDYLVGVAETIREGARLELLLQHDRLGLDKETEYMVEAEKDGRLRQVGVIRDILERIEGDQDVMDRVHKRARILLQHAST
jgi:hypothetical protein